MAAMTGATDNNASAGRRKYWEAFYASCSVSAPNTPSQFAAFVLNELPQLDCFVDMGCGNGRDAEFFASYGKHVLAVDASAEAVKLCKAQRSNHHVDYQQYLLGDDASPLRAHFRAHGQPAMLYARFFLHAITAEEEVAFFDMTASLMPSGSYVALEYRILEDAESAKEYGQHFRRYVNHAEVRSSLEDRGFDIVYDAQGTGLAKYKSEDAVVGRCIAIRR